MARYSRRETIKLALTGFILSPFGCTSTPPSSAKSDDRTEVPPLNSGVRDSLTIIAKKRKKLTHVKHCGKLWLDQQKPRPTIADLETRFAASLSGTSEEMQRTFQQLHARDIKEDRFVSVTGWLLTETETHLYAMFALLDP